MKELLIWALVFLVYAGTPFIATLWFLFCYSGYKNSVPFTEEYDRKKVRAIISGIIAGILDAIFLVTLIIYAVTVMFA